MVIGNKDSFAIQFELDQAFGGSWLFGKICYWIVGIMVGDYELGTSLRDVLFQMRWVVADCGNRAGGALCDLAPEKAFSMLDGLLYEPNDAAATAEATSIDTPARFAVSIPVEVFDDWKVYLIECHQVAIIIFRSAKDAAIRSVVLETGLFDRVIREAFDCLDELYELNRGTPGSTVSTR
jgi:hypothetical protein